MFESKDDLKLMNKVLNDKLNETKAALEASEHSRRCLSKELADALTAKKNAGESAEALKHTVQVLTSKLDESGIVEGYISRIDHSPAETIYGQDGIILTIRVSRPYHPSYMWGNDFREAMNNPAHKDYAKVKPHMDKYRREMNEYHAFHVGQVFLRMPAMEKE